MEAGAEIRVSGSPAERSESAPPPLGASSRCATGAATGKFDYRGPHLGAVSPMQPFRVGVERDVHGTKMSYGAQLDRLIEDPGIEMFHLPDIDRDRLLPEDIEGVNGLISRKLEVTTETFEGLDDLEIIARSGAGYDNLDVDACTAAGVVATHAPQGPTASVVESTLSLLVQCSHNLHGFERRFRERGFREGRDAEMGHLLSSRTLGMVGIGRIGRSLVELLEPLGTEVRVYDPYVSEEEVADLGVELVDRETLFDSSDLVSVHVPLTEETHHLLGYEDFERMDEKAWLVNTSRGGIYPDAELARAIEDGELAGAAVDVFEDEPIVEDNPLLDVERCIVLPHITGRAHETYERTGRIVTEAMIAVRDGRLPENVLNPEVYDREVPEEKLTPSYQPE